MSEFDHVKREIIHQLCIHPMAHSELTKALPEDVSINHLRTHSDSIHMYSRVVIVSVVVFLASEHS